MVKSCTHFPCSDHFFQTNFKPMSLAQASAKARSKKPCPRPATPPVTSVFTGWYRAVSTWLAYVKVTMSGHLHCDVSRIFSSTTLVCAQPRYQKLHKSLPSVQYRNPCSVFDSYSSILPSIIQTTCFQAITQQYNTKIQPRSETKARGLVFWKKLFKRDMMSLGVPGLQKTDQYCCYETTIRSLK